MSVWIERFALTLLATLAGANLLYNPWKLDRTYQAGITIIILGVALVFGRWVELNRVSPVQDKRGGASPPPAAASVAAAPAQPQPSSPGTEPVVWEFLQKTTPADRFETLFSYATGVSFWVSGFKIAGRNDSNESLVDVHAEVILQVHDKALPLQFQVRTNERVDTADYVVEPGAPFVLVAWLPGPFPADGPHGYHAPEYLSKFGGFKFVFSAKGINRFAHRFTFDEVKDMVLAAEARNIPTPPQPSVRKRE